MSQIHLMKRVAEEQEAQARLQQWQDAVAAYQKSVPEIQKRRAAVKAANALKLSQGEKRAKAVLAIFEGKPDPWLLEQHPANVIRLALGVERTDEDFEDSRVAATRFFVEDFLTEYAGQILTQEESTIMIRYAEAQRLNLSFKESYGLALRRCLDLGLISFTGNPSFIPQLEEEPEVGSEPVLQQTPAFDLQAALDNPAEEFETFDQWYSWFEATCDKRNPFEKGSRAHDSWFKARLAENNESEQKHAAEVFEELEAALGKAGLDNRISKDARQRVCDALNSHRLHVCRQNLRLAFLGTYFEEMPSNIWDDDSERQAAGKSAFRVAFKPRALR